MVGQFWFLLGEPVSSGDLVVDFCFVGGLVTAKKYVREPGHNNVLKCS